MVELGWFYIKFLAPNFSSGVRSKVLKQLCTYFEARAFQGTDIALEVGVTRECHWYGKHVFPQDATCFTLFFFKKKSLWSLLKMNKNRFSKHLWNKKALALSLFKWYEIQCLQLSWNHESLWFSDYWFFHEWRTQVSCMSEYLWPGIKSIVWLSPLTW